MAGSARDSHMADAEEPNARELADFDASEHSRDWTADASDEEICMDTPFLGAPLDYQTVAPQNAAGFRASLTAAERRKLLYRSALKIAAIFGGCLIVLVLTLRFGLPVFDAYVLRV